MIQLPTPLDDLQDLIHFGEVYVFPIALTNQFIKILSGLPIPMVVACFHPQIINRWFIFPLQLGHPHDIFPLLTLITAAGADAYCQQLRAPYNQWELFDPHEPKQSLRNDFICRGFFSRHYEPGYQPSHDDQLFSNVPAKLVHALQLLPETYDPDTSPFIPYPTKKTRP